MTDVISSILLVLVGLIIGIVIMFIVNLIRKNSATNKADKILENARTEAEKIKRETAVSLFLFTYLILLF